MASQLGERLMRLRIAAGFGIDEAAARAGIEQARLEAAERDAWRLDSPELERLAELYGVDMPTLFGGRTTPLQDFA
jgi:transcriptional regulator with XRE-family HTH domain